MIFFFITDIFLFGVGKGEAVYKKKIICLGFFFVHKIHACTFLIDKMLKNNINKVNHKLTPFYEIKK